MGIKPTSSSNDQAKGKTLVPMLKKTFYILLILFCKESSGQSFLNGNFENNTAVVDQINLFNSQYNIFMSNSVGFGIVVNPSREGNLDIITSSTYCGGAQNGNWFVALSSGGSDALSLELSSPLITGESYSISFYDRSCSPHPAGNSIQIGVSTTNNNFGNLVYTAPRPTYNGGWSKRIFSFIAPINGLYITVKCDGPNDASLSWTQVDNFSFNCSYTLNLGNDTTLCQGQSIILNGDSASSYLWSNGSTNSSINVSSSGTYWVQAINGQCSGTDSIVISINQYPTPNLGNDTTLCQGQSIILNGGSASSYLWSNGSTTSSINVSSSGTYWFQASNGQCSATDSIVVNIVTIEAGLDQSICSGDSVQLFATGGNSYTWSPIIGLSNPLLPNPKASPTNTVDYIVKGTLGLCFNYDTVRVIINQLPEVDLGSDTTICSNESHIFYATVKNANLYNWQPETLLNNSKIQNPTTQINTSQTFILTATNSLTSCENSDTIIVETQKPTAQFSLSDTTSSSTPFIVSPNNTSYPLPLISNWEMMDTITAYYTDFEPTHSFTHFGRFKILLTVQDDRGCTDSISKFVYLKKESNIFIPNAFTPNGNGLNDVFEIRFIPGTLLSMQGSIWNRWGTKIYEFGSPNYTWWNGKFENEDVSGGVYFYIVDVINLENKIQRFNGTVILLR